MKSTLWGLYPPPQKESLGTSIINRTKKSNKGCPKESQHEWFISNYFVAALKSWLLILSLDVMFRSPCFPFPLQPNLVLHPLWCSLLICHLTPQKPCCFAWPVASHLGVGKRHKATANVGVSWLETKRGGLPVPASVKQHSSSLKVSHLARDEPT